MEEVFEAIFLRFHVRFEQGVERFLKLFKDAVPLVPPVEWRHQLL